MSWNIRCRVDRRSLQATIWIVAVCASNVGSQTQSARHTPSAADLAQADSDLRQAEVDKRIFVLPPPKGFSPVLKDPIRLHLSLETDAIRKEEPVRYRLELINLGMQAYTFNESFPSFFKSGRLPADRIRLFIVDPAGHESEVVSPRKFGSDIGLKEVRFPPGWSDAQKSAWIESENIRNRSRKSLFVRLDPGETLFTPGDAPGDRFRSLLTSYRFKKPGAYSIRAELDTRFHPTGVVSNSVQIRVR